MAASAINRAAGHEMARCRICDYDLEVRVKKPRRVAHHWTLRDHFIGESDGKVYCSNSRCPNYRGHPTGPELNLRSADA